jgi:mannosylglucosylglycerate synthase
MTRSVVIVHYTPPGVVGGVEHIIYQHARLLESRGFSVTLVAGRNEGAALPVTVIPEIDAAREDSATLEAQLAAGAVPPAFWEARNRILDALLRLAGSADRVLVHNAFTLHFSLPLTAALWTLAVRAPAGKYLAWSHDLSWTNPLYQPTMHPGYPWNLLRLPAPGVRYVTVSDARRHELGRLWEGLGVPVVTIPNGIDVPTFLRLSPRIRDLYHELRLAERDAVLLLPVRITRRKNIELAIRATAELRDRGLDVLFLVSGPVAQHHPGRSATYLTELKALRDELGLGRRVRFLADEMGTNFDVEEVAHLYTLADLLLFPSEQEGFGLPIVEAALARVPAVLTDIPIFREVGGAEAYYVGLDWDAGRIAEVICAALDERPSRSYRRALRTYSWERILDTAILPLLID